MSEVTKERRYQSRAFLILPMSFNTAGILGPREYHELVRECASEGLILTIAVMGGILANASKTMPGFFGKEALFGFQWIQDYPYALPSLVNAFALILCTLTIWLFLREVRYGNLWQFDLMLTMNRRRDTEWDISITVYKQVTVSKRLSVAAGASSHRLDGLPSIKTCHSRSTSLPNPQPQHHWSSLSKAFYLSVVSGRATSSSPSPLAPSSTSSSDPSPTSGPCSSRRRDMLRKTQRRQRTLRRNEAFRCSLLEAWGCLPRLSVLRLRFWACSACSCRSSCTRLSMPVWAPCDLTSSSSQSSPYATSSRHTSQFYHPHLRLHSQCPAQQSGSGSHSFYSCRRPRER